MSLTRVMHVALQLETGGMERLLVEFARHADRHRYDLSFVALGRSGPVAAEIQACGWPVTALNVGPGTRPSIIYRLARLFREQRIDIVHAHNTKPLLYAGPAAKLARIGGVVYTRHGQRRGATSRQNALFRLTSRFADRLVCVSHDSARLCAQEQPRAGSIRTIHNGIDTQKFTYSGPAAGGPALYVGRLSPEKDIATLLRATALVVRQDPRFYLHIAGAGPCAAELAQLTQELELSRHVRLLGEVQDVPALLRTASMFILPSLTEGLPLTVLEAMARGLPVVATRVGGTPEAVEDGHTGLLVPSGQPESLAAAILRICSNPDLARQMGIAGRQRTEREFEIRTMVSRYQSLYQEVLGVSTALAA